MRRRAYLAILLVVMGAGPVLAAEPAPSTPAPKPAKAAPSPDDVICTEQEVTGSMFSQRVCLTRAQRAKMAEDGRKSIDDSRRVNTLSQGKGGG